MKQTSLNCETNIIKLITFFFSCKLLKGKGSNSHYRFFRVPTWQTITPAAGRFLYHNTTYIEEPRSKLRGIFDRKEFWLI